MFPNSLVYSDTRIQDFWRDYRHSAECYGLPADPGLGSQLRQAAGEALVALGYRIKPRPAQDMAGVWLAR